MKGSPPVPSFIWVIVANTATSYPVLDCLAGATDYGAGPSV